jgi:hypothetical protein
VLKGALKGGDALGRSCSDAGRRHKARLVEVDRQRGQLRRAVHAQRGRAAARCGAWHWSALHSPTEYTTNFADDMRARITNVAAKAHDLWRAQQLGVLPPAGY